ncbi:MAG TPA: sugar phosphate nucleotidyltransferase [Terracidiphilus sp.]|jgi:NDP-sugar pyrophosphorylase family protein|nr:sugar phosphate nucleotidyltransferase [Terracidiphilus sp.]
MTTPTLLVLAAGMGSRYGGMKQIDPVGPEGETIMDYSIFDARRAGFGKVVFVIRKEIEQQFREVIGTRYNKRIPVDYVFQEIDKLVPPHLLPAARTKPWGTTHAVLMAASVIREPFAVINADDFYGEDSFRAIARHLQSGSADYSMVGFVLRDTLSDFGSVARGICTVDEHGYLERIVERTSIEREGEQVFYTGAEGHRTALRGDEAVSMNMWGFTPQIFPQLAEQFEEFLNRSAGNIKAECYIPSTVNELIAAKLARVKVLPGGKSWFGVTYREDRPRAVDSIRRLVEGGYYPKGLWA